MENRDSKIEWQAQEFFSIPRSQEIIAAMSIIAVNLLIFGIFTKNYLFILIIALIGFIMYLHKQKGAEIMDISIDQKGITINKKLYYYEGFKSFWIFGQDHEHGRELALRSDKRFMPLLLVPLANADINSVKAVLEKHLPEQEEKESLIDILRKAFF